MRLMFKDQALIVMGKLCLIIFPFGIALAYAIQTWVMPVYYQLAEVLQVK